MHLITAQEVAGLNPAEVTYNEGVNAPSFLFRLKFREPIKNISPYTSFKAAIIIFCYESIHNKYYKLLYVQHLYVHLNKQIEINFCLVVWGEVIAMKKKTFTNPHFFILTYIFF